MKKLPPNQQLIKSEKWPTVGERTPRQDESPWTVGVYGLVKRPRTFDLAELLSGSVVPLDDVVEDIHCVTRWSKFDVPFRGITLAALLHTCEPADDARFVLFAARSDRNHSTSIPIELARRSFVAFEAYGRQLTSEHGGPVRLIVPGRYFYKSLKWLEKVEVVSQDRLGYWESEAGYHNNANPWKEERYLAPSLSKRDAVTIIASLDFQEKDLRGIDCSKRDMTGLKAANSLLRDARFESASLRNASFRGSNLSNARFANADLRNCDFCDADVEGADFSGADLHGADFRVASMFGATFVQQTDGEIVAARCDANTRFDELSFDQLTDGQRELFWQHVLRR
ncbi:MAG: molybdopterin-dependent oxidoreductase [Planctomycetales bacterium]|nr:molybdopterin-dependent oxidoreductase [Planctomycetales bacterium]